MASLETLLMRVRSETPTTFFFVVSKAAFFIFVFADEPPPPDAAAAALSPLGLRLIPYIGNKSEWSCDLIHGDIP